MAHELDISSPKRSRRSQTGWSGYFPYYAGFPEDFATRILGSAKLSDGALVVDPWNGSGTTTYVGGKLGLATEGFDINPVMVIVARARLFPPCEVDSVEPLAQKILRAACDFRAAAQSPEPLSTWLADDTARTIRSIERSVHSHLIGAASTSSDRTNIDRLSGLAATFYVALFNVCRSLVTPFRSSNPTWLRRPKTQDERVEVPRWFIFREVEEVLREMMSSLYGRPVGHLEDHSNSTVRLADTCSTPIASGSIDFVLSSPPYCTRIDYAAATCVELALIEPLNPGATADLSRQMLGSTRVPAMRSGNPSDWGNECSRFLLSVERHSSKASSGYYYSTHLDYFFKMDRSLLNIASGLKPNGRMALVVQDSYYKDIHNNLPTIVTEMCEIHGLRLTQRKDYYMRRSMSGINPHTRLYNRAPGAAESVLCFVKPT